MNENIENNKVSKKNGSKTTIYILVIIGLLFLVGGLAIVLLNPNDKDENNNPKEDDEINEPQINISEEEIEEYLTYVPVLPEHDSIESYAFDDDAYTGQKVTRDDLDEKLLLAMAYNYAKGTETDEEVEMPICGEEPCIADKYITLEDMNSQLMKMYNLSGVNEIIAEFKIPGGTVVKTNKYWAVFYGMGALKIEKVNKYVSYEVKNEELIIREKAGFIYDNVGAFSLYTDTVGTNKLVEESLELPTSYFDEHSDEFNTYIHTFKKAENGKYYWYSTEIEK